MARGRHVRRSGLLAWLLSLRTPQPSWRAVHARSLLLQGDGLRALDEQVSRLREAEQRSVDSALLAERRAAHLERELATVRAQVTALQADLTAVREELVWAFAERRLPVDAPRVIDLPRPVADTA